MSVTQRALPFVISLLLAGSAGAQEAEKGATVQVPSGVDQPAEGRANPQAAYQAADDAYAAGDMVSARRVLSALFSAGDTGSEEVPADAHLLYGQLLLNGRGGPQDIAGSMFHLEQAAGERPEAATLLARIHLSGQSLGVPRDAERARSLLEQASEMGYPEAHYYLALLLPGVSTTEETRARIPVLLEQAAKAGHVEAQYQLSSLLSRGEGVPPDPEGALTWLVRAAENGHGMAQFNLAYALGTGQGLTQDREAAAGWLLRASENGLPAAQRMLGQYYLEGTGVPANRGEALRWLNSAAATGDVAAQYYLGQAYRRGPEDGSEDALAWKWLNEASGAGYAPASTALGEMAERGGLTASGTRQAGSIELALPRYLKAVSQGDLAAARRLGQLAISGELEGLTSPHEAVPWVVAAGIADDTAGAAEWLRAQSEAGVRPAQTALGLWLLNREGAAEAAAPHFETAANAGDTEAQLELGLLYSEGRGVPQDLIMAHKWLNIAASTGSARARERRDAVADLLTPEDLSRAQTAARRFFEDAAATPPARSTE
ncbi:tetratricopeptide repeat protein [Maritimibacter alkaliphilus]|uniref:tetratricopeptide repeat protein n=1 Tax=Maritimibacter alkaliphilus TaxID=404236 RepID=UPI001C954BD4|nr:SEL1-like repeat protein [Maritimibacter alkaliphilus]MBY6092514.1 SEL1-like repeat protein [Maritimibacter alkaliphilus]